MLIEFNDNDYLVLAEKELSDTMFLLFYFKRGNLMFKIEQDLQKYHIICNRKTVLRRAKRYYNAGVIEGITPKDLLLADINLKRQIEILGGIE